LSGHDARGNRANQPHIAFVPLPWVGFEHADGSIMGLAIVMPRATEKNDRMLLLRLLARWESERGDASDDYSTELCTPPGCGYPISMRLKRCEMPTKVALNSERWCKPSRRFITATPIALDRHPGNLRSNAAGTAQKAADEAAATIADACELIGLPRPVNVSISLAPLLPGAQHVRQFTPWPAKPGKIRRARVHADIVFSEKVRGPLLLGAGRYFGLGLCLPISEAWRQPMEGNQP
jgi:CRISPR-associated protein Csb2